MTTMNTNPNEPVVCVAGLSKKRGKKQVLDDLSFEIHEGRVFGLIGPNGAGKTTMIKILLAMLAPDSGTTHIFGEPSMEMSLACRRRIGYLAEDDALENLPIAELLEFQSYFFDRWDWGWCAHLIDKLKVVRGRTLSEMSRGERRKAELLVALAHKPDLLLLDDPAIGLDATVRREILWVTLEAAKQQGKTIIFTSHILQDVERIVDDVLILDRGRARMRGTLDELHERTRRIVLPNLDERMEPEPLPGEISRKRHGRDLVVVTEQFTSDMEQELQRSVPGVTFENLNLEEIFCEVIGEAAERDQAEERA